jgi:hypothetical protein
MKSGKRKDFILWYGQNYNNRFDLKEKLVDYCLSDVRLLSEGLVRYRQIMLSECKFDVLRKCTTLAGTMMTHFRMNHLKTDGPKIGVASELSYERHDKQSTIARKFLKWTAAKHNIDIQHCESAGGEKRLGKFLLDGYVRGGKSTEIRGIWQSKSTGIF